MGEGKTILVVDDDDDIRMTLREILQDEGYRVTTASNGREALRALRSGDAPPSLILLDLMMPVMDGTHFRAEQRKDASIAGIPVVVITASGDAAHGASGLEVASIIQKPVSLDTLLEMVSRYAA